MKRSLLTLMLAMTALFVSAQATVGPKFGLNFSTVTHDNEYAEKVAIPGIHAGLVLQMGGDLAIQPEILYTQKGVRFEAEGGEEYWQQTNNYLEVPLLLKMSFGPELFKFFVNAGPYAAYWLSGTAKMDHMGEEVVEDYEFDDDDSDGYSDNRFDYGIAAGAGLALKLGPGYLTGELRYDLGLADTQKVVDEWDDYEAVMNRTIGISFGYIVPLGE